MECDMWNPDGDKFVTGMAWICEPLDTEPPLVRLVEDCKSTGCDGTHYEIKKGDKQ